MAARNVLLMPNVMTALQCTLLDIPSSQAHERRMPVNKQHRQHKAHQGLLLTDLELFYEGQE